MKQNINIQNKLLFIVIVIVSCLYATVTINNVNATTTNTATATNTIVAANNTLVAAYENNIVTTLVPIWHKVVFGDCVYRIAINNATTIKKIKKWNNLRNPRIINVGDSLIVGWIKIKKQKNEKIYNFDYKYRLDKEQNLNYPYYIIDYICNVNKDNNDANISNNNFFQNKSSNLFSLALSTIGKIKYRFGAKMRKIGKYIYSDCSGYVNYLLIKSGRKSPGNSTIKIFSRRKRFNQKDLKIGSLVGWPPGTNGRYGHVYLYVGKGKFANISSKHGINFASYERICRMAKRKKLYIANT